MLPPFACSSFRCHSFSHMFASPLCTCLRETNIWAMHGVRTSPFFVSFSHYIAMLCCWVFCASLSPLWRHFGSGRLSLLTSQTVPCPPPPPPLRVLPGPGLPSRTDAARPTTAQCIRPAAPRDCPRTSLSQSPPSSSLVRRRGQESA